LQGGLCIAGFLLQGEGPNDEENVFLISLCRNKENKIEMKKE
jgi:hypothetical protein